MSEKTYDIVIGLEIHAELNTATKMFCACLNDTSKEPNTNVCQVCLALPGALPVPSRVAIEKTITSGLAFDCKINNQISFERKNYFYPDLPKAYQISQMQEPICLGGGVTLKGGKRIRLNRIHLEEDAGKLFHNEVHGETYVDLNRCGVPLIEIVTEPDISSSTDAIEFLEQVRSRLVFSGVADCKMEEGGMRVDVNISLKPTGSTELGNRIELKNINSFKMAARAIEYEAKRQATMLDDGREIKTETRKWNDARGISTPMRGKEVAFDYRYFPDPDQLAIKITKAEVDKLKKDAPKLSGHYYNEFVNKLKLPPYNADILTRDKSFCTLFLNCVQVAGETNAIKLSTWFINDILALATNYDVRLTEKQILDIIDLTDTRQITKQNALVLLESIWSQPSEDAKAHAQKLGLVGGVDVSQLETIIADLIAKNPQAVADYTATPDKVLNFFMGQTMKATQGKADSIRVREILLKLL